MSMKIQFFKQGICDVPRVRLVEELLNLGFIVNLAEKQISVEISEFNEFLRAYYRACARMSKTEEGSYLRITFAVRVLYGGRWYDTSIRFDEEAKGVRYGSLS